VPPENVCGASTPLVDTDGRPCIDYKSGMLDGCAKIGPQYNIMPLTIVG